MFFVIFFIQDKILKLENIKKISFIRFLSNIIVGGILLFLTTRFVNSRSFNTILITSSVFLVINTFINTLVYKKKVIKDISKIIFIVLLLELSLFNYKHYLTFFNKPVEVKDYTVENLVQVDDGYISTFKDGGSIVIPTHDLDINNIYFNIHNKNDKLITYIIEVYDLESDQYVYLNTVNSYRGVIVSNYKTIQNTYKTDKFKFTLIDSEDSVYTIKGIILNPVTPVVISYLRIVFLVAFMAFAYLLNIKKLYTTKVSSDNKMFNSLLTLFSILIIVIVFVLTNVNGVFRGNNYYSTLKKLHSVNEYQLLAESMSNGKLYLEIEPSESLKNMENPYNYINREKTVTGEDIYLWDAAYYNNHYYVYFGVVPVIFSYLPFYVLTHHHLNNNFVLFIGLVGIIISLITLFKKLVKKYFPNTSIGTFFLLLLFILVGNHFVILYAAKRPDFYSIPIVWGTMFTLIGLNLWLSSIKDNKINKTKLALGSLSMALVAGCRPQLLLVSFASIIIFFDYFKKKEVFKKETILELLSFAIPYIVVAIMLMIYNYLRFGSPFDFGANYNLTTNDMTVRGFNIERIGLGLYYYLIAIPRGINKFPFFEMIPLSTSYIGTTIYEEMFGGLLILYPFLWLNIFICKLKHLFKEKILFRLCLLFIISSLIIILADINMAGILPRYNLDFTWMLFLSASIISLYIFEHFKDNKLMTNFLNKGVFVLLFISVLINFFMLFIDVSYVYKVTIPTIYYYFYYFIQFWL